MGMSIDFIELFNSYNHAYGAHASICLCTHSLQKIWEVDTMAFVCVRAHVRLTMHTPICATCLPGAPVVSLSVSIHLSVYKIL